MNVKNDHGQTAFDIADEQDVVPGLDTPGVHCIDDGQQGRETRAVVADAGRAEPIALASHFDVGAFREDRVEVRGDDHYRAPHGALAQSEDIAFWIDGGD